MDHESILDKLKSLFESDNEDKHVEQIQNLNKEVAEHGWCPNKDAARFSFCKSYSFPSDKEASNFLVKAISDKTSSHHVHFDMVVEQKSKLDVYVYADNENYNVKCLQMCLFFDNEYDKLT